MKIESDGWFFPPVISADRFPANQPAVYGCHGEESITSSLKHLVFPFHTNRENTEIFAQHSQRLHLSSSESWNCFQKSETDRAARTSRNRAQKGLLRGEEQIFQHAVAKCAQPCNTPRFPNLSVKLSQFSRRKYFRFTC